MKSLLNLLTISTLSIFSGSSINAFTNHQQNINNWSLTAKNNLVVSKVESLDLDINYVGTFGNTILAGSKANPPYSKRGLYNSTDGLNFIRTSLVDSEVNNIVSSQNGTLYLTDGDFLKKSSDGINYSWITTFNEAVQCVAISSDNIIYIGAETSLYKSTDGATFNKIYDFGTLYVEKIKIATNNTLYLITGSGGSREFVNKSFDGGYHFMQIPNINFVSDICITADNKIYILAFSVYKSEDNGNTFVEILNPKGMWIFRLFSDLNNNLYLTTSHTLYKLNINNILDEVWSFSEVITMGTYAANGIIWLGSSHGLFKLWYE